MAQEIIYTKGYANNYAECEPVELESTPQTRTVFQGHISDQGVGGNIVRYKLGKDGKAEPIKQDFKNIAVGDGVKVKLSNSAVKKLLDTILKFDKVRSDGGIAKGIQKYTLVDQDDLVISDKNVAKAVQSMLKNDAVARFWATLSSESPDTATTLADSRIQQMRRESLAEFQELMKNDEASEAEWQEFFEDNKWVFGLGLRYQILKVSQAQPHYGGEAIDGKGDQRGDFLTHSQATVKYTCLVEIKKHSTELLGKKYRNGAYPASEELSGAVAQVQANCAKWEINGSRNDENQDKMGDIHTIQPKGLVVIGNTAELEGDRGKWSSFERFRRNTLNPEIITFDELLERAKFIVDGDQDNTNNASEVNENVGVSSGEVNLDDLPF